jgi:23S rRNA (adenine2503-C2)-methyltransferase
MDFSRQLTAAEIFEQAQKFSSELQRENRRLSNVVMMGMGEPLANYNDVMEAVRRMNTELGIGARHITILTVGLAPRIRKLAEEDLQVCAIENRPGQDSLNREPYIIVFTIFFLS